MPFGAPSAAFHATIAITPGMDARLVQPEALAHVALYVPAALTAFPSPFQEVLLGETKRLEQPVPTLNSLVLPAQETVETMASVV